MEAFWALTPVEKRLLIARILASYPEYVMPDQEFEILSNPLTWLLTALLAPDLPQGDTQTSPSEIVVWVGEAAANRDDDPTGFVWGRINNRTYSGQLTSTRERGFVRQHQRQEADALERYTSAETFARLREVDQWTLVYAATYSIGVQAAIWGLTYDGAEDRLRRARARLQKLFSRGQK